MFQRLVPLVSWENADRFWAGWHDQIMSPSFLPLPLDLEYRACNLEGISGEPLVQTQYSQKMMPKVTDMKDCTCGPRAE